MKSTLLACFILLFGITNAQHITAAYNSTEMQALQKGPIYILPTGDENFDECLLASVATFWKICPYKALTAAEAPKYLQDPNNIFIAPSVSFTRGFPCKVVSPFVYDSGRCEGMKIFIFHGSKGSKSIDDIEPGTDFISCGYPLLNPAMAATVMVYVIKNLNDNVQIVLDNKIVPVNKWTGKMSKAISEGFCKNPIALKTKTLLIDQSMIPYILSDNTLKAYKYKYLTLETLEIGAVLNTTACKDYCLLTNCSGSLEIYDCETKGKIWSGEKNNTGIGSISLKNINALNEAIAEAK
jgi:hypothetical protein